MESRQHEAGLLVEGQELAGLGVWTSDLVTRVITWSPELYRICGFDAAAAPAYDAWLASIHPDDVARVIAFIAQARRDGAPHALDYRIVRPDGSVRTLDARVRATLDARGVASRLIGTVLDITERNELAARALIADRTAAIATLAAGVAHEINNPLAPISTNIELIRAELLAREPSAEVVAMLDEIRQGLDRIQRIVGGLTTFSRANADDRAPVDVGRVMDFAIDLAGSTIRARARLVKEHARSPHVVANEAQLTQVFVNLLLNAAHAIPDGAPDRHEIRVVTGTDAAGRALIEVHDTGHGIPYGLQRRIFDPFFTTRKVGGGTGLGLSICHGIVESLGGTISVDSEPGKRTTFRVVLPAADASPSVVEAVKPAVRASTRRGRVLIVDDEIIFGNSLRRLLSHDHHVTVTNSGPQALEALTAGTAFDIILCDLMMPDMTGMELYGAVCARAPEQAARMVFMTGGAFTPESRAFLEKMTDRWFEKPCDVRRLRDLVRAHVH